MIDRNSPIPIYYQLKMHFKNQMEQGDLQAGDRLPTEMELCDQYDISRAPVRQAMMELAREGLIYRRPGQGTFVAPTAATSVAEKTKINVLAHYDVRWMASLEQAVLAWNAANPDRRVELSIQLCGREDFHKVLRRKAIQGEAPDMASMDYAWLVHYANEGYLKSLDSLDSDWVGDVMRDLETPVLRNNTIDDQLYGVPVQADVSGLWYRKDWFEQEGLQPPETWDAWLNQLDHFGSRDVMDRYGHRFPVVLPVTATTGETTVNLLIPFIWMSGGEIIDARGDLTLHSHTPEVAKALRYLQQITLQRRSFLPQDVYRSRWWHLARFFAQGDVPMALGGSYEWPRIQEESMWDNEEDASESLGFMMLPRPDPNVNPVGSLGGTSWAIFTQSKEQELCVEILKLMASSDISQAFCEDNLQISPFRSVNQQLMTASHPWLSEVVPLLTYARHRPLISDYVRISGFLQDMFERVLWGGENPEAAVRETAQALSVILSGSST